MELELKRLPGLNVKLDGKTYSLRRPNLGERLKLERTLKEKGEGSESLLAIMEFLFSIGLPKDVLTTLEPEMIEEILLALNPSKKK